LIRGTRGCFAPFSAASAPQQPHSRRSFQSGNMTSAQSQAKLSPSVAEAGASLSSFPLFKPSLVIFDKDGTLVCFHTMWNSWCEQLASRMKEETTKEVSTELYSMLGYDQASKRVRMGMLAEKTHPYIMEKVVEMLMTEFKFNKEEATEVMDKTWKDTPENMQIKSTGNLGLLFKTLKEQDIKIAICTSDSREGTEEFLTKLSLESMVDLVLCGDDKDSISKPNPHNALFICEKLGVCPSKTIMVGDTPADTIMGQAANLGLTVGVLTGVGDNKDLSDADLIVPEVGDIIDLVTASEKSEMVPKVSKNMRITGRGLSKIVSQSSIHK